MAVSFIRLASARRNTLAMCLFAALSAGASAAPKDNAGSFVPERPQRTTLPNQSLLGAGGERDALFGTEHAAKSQSLRLSGNVVSVTSCADDGSVGTLRDAIENAADGDTIDMSDLTCSLITLQSGALVSSVATLAIQGPGVDALTIDGDDTTRVLEGTNLDVSDVTIAHGMRDSYTGGGCIFTYGDLSLTRAKVSACKGIISSSSAAGGAAIVLGNLTMHDSAITGNTATGLTAAGGGGAFVAGTASLYDSIVSGNTVEATQDYAAGGGLSVIGDIALHGSTITGNKATSADGRAYGGGLHAKNAVEISILDASTISNNTAHSDTNWSYGGGVNSGMYGAATSTAIKIEHSTISGNEADSDCVAGCFVSGGGVHAFDSIAADYATFNDNQALCNHTLSGCTAAGGALSTFGSQSVIGITLRNTTVSANSAIGGTQATALGTGGGLWIGSNKQLLSRNSTIAFNHASENAGGIALSSPANAPSELTATIVSNNDTDNGANDIAGPFGNLAAIQGANNLVMNSAAGVTLPGDTLTVDPNLLPLTTDDGGTTATHPLPTNSAAVDAGSNIDLLGCDQRGYPYHRVAGSAADIGAYEIQELLLFADNFDGSPTCPKGVP